MDFTQDPILGSSMSTSPSSIDQIAAYNEECAKKIAEMQRRNFTLQPQQSKTPTWDEIDKIMDGLTDSQKSYLNENQEFIESYNEVANILQREYLRVMRPLVEQTKDGKDALDKHLTLIKRLKKSAMQADESERALMNEYITKYSDKTWQEFMEIVKQRQKGGAK